jgi:hypothetical protein
MRYCYKIGCNPFHYWMNSMTKANNKLDIFIMLDFVFFHLKFDKSCLN